MDRNTRLLSLSVVAIIVVVAVVAIAWSSEDGQDRRTAYHSSMATEVVYGDTVAECMFERDGFAFVGWNTVSDGSGVTYMPGDSLSDVSGAWDLYAQWVPTVSSVMYSADAREFVSSFLIVYDDGSSVRLDRGVRLDNGAHLELAVDLPFALEDGTFVAEASGRTVSVDAEIFGAVTDQTSYLDPDTGRTCWSFTPGGGVAFTIVVSVS